MQALDKMLDIFIAKIKLKSKVTGGYHGNQNGL
jgi:hypothetical protein